MDQQFDKRLTKVEHKLFGNGEIGMDEALRVNTRALEHQGRQLARLDSKLDGVQKSINDLAAERRGDQQRREGAVTALRWIRWGLGALVVVVGLLGALGVSSTRYTLTQITEQLNRLPPLPE